MSMTECVNDHVSTAPKILSQMMLIGWNILCMRENAAPIECVGYEEFEWRIFPASWLRPVWEDRRMRRRGPLPFPRRPSFRRGRTSSGSRREGALPRRR